MLRTFLIKRSSKLLTDRLIIYIGIYGNYDIELIKQNKSAEEGVLT